MPAHALTTVVFDLGGVLVDWDPRHLYRRLLPEDEIEPFLEEIGFQEWNRAQDAGRGWAEAVEQLAAQHPHRRELIAAYAHRYDEALAGELPGTVALLDELHERGTRLLALTNWSAETFPRARERFPFLTRFEGIVVSGEERVAKPDAEVFRRLTERFAVDPREAAFVDDSPANVATARRLGFTGLVFTDADTLRADLARLGLVGRDGALSPTPPQPARGAG
jgi:2-haloacid dehalogenase